MTGQEHLPSWLRPTWLPRADMSRPPVLEEVRERHRHLLEGWGSARSKLTELLDRFADEDAAARVALEHAVRTGAEEEPVAVTSQARRMMELQVAEERIDAALCALCDVVEDAVVWKLRRREHELDRAFEELLERGLYNTAAQAEAGRLRQLVVTLHAPENVLEELRRIRGEVEERRRGVAVAA